MELLKKMGLGTGFLENHGAGAFPSNSSKPQKYKVEVVSKRSDQVKITEPNTTKKHEQIVGYFERTRTIKDDEDEAKYVTQNNKYFIVRRPKIADPTAFYHEIMPYELCGAMRAWKMLDATKALQLVNSKTKSGETSTINNNTMEIPALSDLPSKRQIDAYDWGIEFIAARGKLKVKDAGRQIPVLAVCMWWMVEDESKHKKFTVGFECGNPKERRVLLGRGDFHNHMGKERGDAQICESLPHPQNGSWESVEHCIQYYTTEKTLAAGLGPKERCPS